jgi:hypothetical protein
MKMQLILCQAILVLTGMQITAEAQYKSPELIRIEDKLVRSVALDMADWKHRSGSTIEGSEDVAIDSWTLENKARVGITIIRYSSPEEAQEQMKHFILSMKGVKSVSDFADEQYSLSRPGDTAFRINQFYYSLSIIAAEADEADKLLKRFAKFVADAIKDK